MGKSIQRRRTPHAAARSGDCYLTGTVVLTALIDGGWLARVTGVVKNPLPRTVQIADRLPDVSRSPRGDKTLSLRRAGSHQYEAAEYTNLSILRRGYIFCHETTKKSPPPRDGRNFLLLVDCSSDCQRPALLAAYNALSQTGHRCRPVATVDPPGIRPDDRSWRAHTRALGRADRRGDSDDDAPAQWACGRCDPPSRGVAGRRRAGASRSHTAPARSRAASEPEPDPRHRQRLAEGPP